MLMRPTTTVALALASVGLAQMRPALAETLRCWSVLIEPGDDIRYVLEKCTEPASSTTLTEPPFAAGIYAYLYQTGITHAGRWRFHRGPGLFPVVLSIADDGSVQAIEFDRHRDPEP